jgi:TRAP-type C4-dicarboxylate transport system substrate-binding protein
MHIIKRLEDEQKTHVEELYERFNEKNLQGIFRVYIKELENKILIKTKEFNTYKLEVLYDFEEMNQQVYDTYEKEIGELTQKKDKIIIGNKKPAE